MASMTRLKSLNPRFIVNPMLKPALPREVHLQPGDWHFAGGGTRIHTLLGSCVSLVFWHPRRRLGGMCHFMLPTRGRPAAELDGRYGDEAMLLLLEAMRSRDSKPAEFQLRIFGGGNMFPNFKSLPRGHVGQQNIDMANRLVARYGLVTHGEHVGGIGHRHIIFDIWSGQLALKQSASVVGSDRQAGVQSA